MLSRLHLRSLPLHRLPFMRWLPEWRQRGTVRADAMAGLVGAVVVLPQGVAFATLAGLPPQYGLYAAIVPCMVAALFGSSRLMMTGPANAISLTTIALISPLAVVGSDDYIRLVLTLTFLVGVMQLLLGIARLGSLVDRVPHSVVVGFTAGAAVLVANSQVGNALGLNLRGGTSLWTNALGIWQNLASIQWPALIASISTASIAVLASRWRRLSRWVPSMLTALVAGTLISMIVAELIPSWPVLLKVAALSGAFPPLSWPHLHVDTVRSLFGATLVMTLLALTEATAIAKAVARKRGDTLDGNQEFIGQGMANVAGSLFSAYPTSGSFNRSGLNVESGARTPLSAVFAALFLVLILLFVSPLAGYLPVAVIAGLLFVVAWGLIDLPEIRRVWREERLERVPLAVTIAATIVLSLEWGILLGITSAMLVRRTMR